ncbi:MAG: glycerophosphodiester phosphodiesterase family protein [Clostridiales bacterium]|nr:glycerophosphodiester phosphodiesterase family protein [Clostridiales bacterium]
MKFNLQEQALSRPLITAHRGISCANIPGNTRIAFEAALCQGADMIELDVSNAADGELFIFHPGMERIFLGLDKRLYELSSEEIRKLRFLNYDQVITDYPLMTLDEALEMLKGRCYINIDKFWDNPEAICRVLRRHDMMDQVLVKAPYSENVVNALKEIAPEIPFMLVTKNEDPYSEMLQKSGIHYVGAEVLFKEEDAPVASQEYIASMAAKKLIVWVNAIVYNYKTVLAAGHNDDISISGRADEGWGWLLDKGFHIIQTDFPLQLRHYMNGRK